MDAHEWSPLSFHSFLSQLPSFSSFFILYTCTSETWSMGCTWSRRLTDSLLGRIWGRDVRSMGSLDRITSILLVNHPVLVPFYRTMTRTNHPLHTSINGPGRGGKDTIQFPMTTPIMSSMYKYIPYSYRHMYTCAYTVRLLLTFIFDAVVQIRVYIHIHIYV